MLPVIISNEVEPYSCPEAGCSSPPEKTLAGFAEKLDMDAVVVVQADYCYENEGEQARFSAATSIKLVNKQEELIINQPFIETCEDVENRVIVAADGWDVNAKSIDATHASS